MVDTLLEIKNLNVSFAENESWRQVLKNISFGLKKNQIMGIVGESGSGKSTIGNVLLGLNPPKISKIDSGEVIFEGVSLLDLPEKKFNTIRGSKISMIFQEPMSSLNPSMKCGKQVAEILLKHTKLSKSEIKNKVLELFEQVRLHYPEKIYNSYPHQLSGGQKQRVMIAMAIACEPQILIADEPTTALDVTVQKEIIKLLQEIQRQNNMSIIFISHDLDLVSEISDRIIVLYKGEIVEQNTTKQLFTTPTHYYTKALLASRPSVEQRLKTLPTIADIINSTESYDLITTEQRAKHHEQIYSQPPILEIKNLSKTYISSGVLFKKNTFKALENINFNLYEGESKGLVGESGSGKSTIGNAILLLNTPFDGQILYKGTDISKLKGKQLKQFRKEVQIIFQDPYSSLNPKMAIGEAIMEPMIVHNLHQNNNIRKQKAIEILEKVGLYEEHFYRYPHQFSGGQRQRIGIARTIALEPKIIICDESVSALDISIQAQILNLLNQLKEQYHFSYIFISHDLTVVKYFCDNIIVLNKGKIEEENEADRLYANPKSAYTQRLIDAIPKSKW
ncbi:MAG: ABC transporter ATP-binding protein [Bacteroidota bacterium]|nr:ABC transporter ATP-binding protein [Bacteroidota bacterium]